MSNSSWGLLSMIALNLFCPMVIKHAKYSICHWCCLSRLSRSVRTDFTLSGVLYCAIWLKFDSASFSITIVSNCSTNEGFI